MIRADQIPPEVVEAGRVAWLESASDYSRLDDSIRAAIAAAINAWPEMETRPTFYPTRIILPFLKENSDE